MIERRYSLAPLGAPPDPGTHTSAGEDPDQSSHGGTEGEQGEETGTSQPQGDTHRPWENIPAGQMEAIPDWWRSDSSGDEDGATVEEQGGEAGTSQPQANTHLPWENIPAGQMEAIPPTGGSHAQAGGRTEGRRGEGLAPIQKRPPGPTATQGTLGDDGAPLGRLTRS